jgi:hypothetical protein
VRFSCTDETHHRTYSARSLGLSGATFHEPVHATAVSIP